VLSAGNHYAAAVRARRRFGNARTRFGEPAAEPRSPPLDLTSPSDYTPRALRIRRNARFSCYSATCLKSTAALGRNIFERDSRKQVVVGVPLGSRMNVLPEIIAIPRRSVAMASVLVIIGTILLFTYRNVGVLNLHIVPAATTRFQVFWAAAGQPYSESQSRTIWIYPGKHHYNIPLTDLRHVEKLRIDPTKDTGLEVRFRNMALYQDGLKPIEFLRSKEFDTLRSLSGIQERTTGNNGLSVVSADHDAQLEYPHVATETLSNLWVNIFRVLVLVGIAIAFVWCNRRMRRSVRPSSSPFEAPASLDPAKV